MEQIDLAELEADIDLEAIRSKYAQERERRIRPDGGKQYRRMQGELAEYATDPYTAKQERASLHDRVEVLVIGGGIGGLTTATKLRQSGITSLRIMEEGGDFGGTWYWNRYPGVHCDIESHVYMPLLEEVGNMPKWRYAPGDEIRQHLVKLAERFDLYRDVLFHTRATEIVWDNGEWLIHTDRGDSFRATYVVVAAGGLATPKFPGIPGIEKFKGRMFHTSRWDYAYTGGDQYGGLTGLEGKNVAVIGTGATGVQVIPKVAEHAKHLFVFQRTPATVCYRGNRETDENWAGTREPGWQIKRMENFLQITTGAVVDEDLVNDGWTQNAHFLRKSNTGTYVSDLNGEERELAEELLDARTMNAIRAGIDDLIEDPQTAELLKPWYRFVCKRPTFSDFYLPTFNKPNVTLVDTADFGGVTRISENSLFVGDEEYPVDCVVVATGFEVGLSAVLSGALPVVGRKGQTILETWAEGPRTLHGYMTHGFPNFFQLGPVQSANSVNFSLMLQYHGDHITSMISAARDAGVEYIEPTEEMEDAWLEEIRRTAMQNLEFHKKCTPGYYNAEGNPRQSTSYGPGPIPFRALLAEWRSTSLKDVFRSADDFLAEKPLVVVE